MLSGPRAAISVPILSRRFVLCLLTMAMGWPGRVGAVPLKAAIKAAYLSKLADFVTWPPGALPSGAFDLCVIGGRPFGATLARAVSGQSVQQHPVILRRYRRIAANPGCQLMYVTGPDTQSIADILSIVRGTPVLTVTDGQDDAAATGIINFVLQDGHVRFEIDQQEAMESGLVISSKLLGVALHVHRNAAP